MKNLKHNILLLCALFFVNLYGMEVAQQDAPLQAYFAPQDKKKITSKLCSMLDNAKKQILIAIYWITDNNLAEKIIAAKNRNIDVQIVIDESSIDKSGDVVTQLSKNGIVPIICPSAPPNNTGLMHNKFVVVDATEVFTGSANFTQAALNPDYNEKLNFENVIIMNSSDIAQKFINAFVSIKEVIFAFYMNIIAINNPNQLPNWMHNILPDLYKKEHPLQQSIEKRINDYTFDEQKKISSLFGIQLAQQKQPLTDKQLALLRNKGLPNEDISKLSKQEASDLISAFINSEHNEAGQKKMKYHH